jgi:integrase
VHAPTSPVLSNLVFAEVDQEIAAEASLHRIAYSRHADGTQHDAGLGNNLYRLGVPDMVIQRILRHANASTAATYYIKTAAVDVRNAMMKLENHIAEADRIQSD